MREIEIKSALSESKKGELLSAFPTVRRAHQEDVYFDTPKCVLFKHGVFVRKRDDNSLDIKYNPNTLDLTHTACDEYSYKVNQITKNDLWDISNFIRDVANIDVDIEVGETIGDLFEKLGLSEFVTISKDRRYIDMGDNVECVIDEIDGIGSFIEVEVNDECYVHKINEAAQKYELQNIPVGYVELWLRKHAFDTYKAGRYVLDEDREQT